MASQVTRNPKKAARRASRAQPQSSPTEQKQPPAIASTRTLRQAAFSGTALWVSLSLAAVTILVYSSVWNWGFVSWDDTAYITLNKEVQRGLSWENVVWAFRSEVAANWHPLTVLSHMLDVQLFGLNAGAHHITSLVLHVICTILLFGLLHGITNSLWRSAFVAGLFAVHPMHVESVAWVAERKDVLSTCFFLLTLWHYFKYTQARNWKRYLAALAMFAAGLMSKPMLVTVPFVLLLMDFWPLGRIKNVFAFRDISPLALEKIPFFVLTAGLSIVTIAIQRDIGAMQSLPFVFRVQNALVSYAAYLSKLLWPSGLAALYPLRHAIPASWVVVSIIVLCGISILAIRLVRRCPYLPAGWFWYLGTLVPVIGLIQVGDQSMADRYTYIPSIGLFVAAAWGIGDMLERPKRGTAITGIAGAVLLTAYAVVAHQQVQYWKDSMSLWTRALSVTSENHRAYNLMGDELAGQGKFSEALKNYSESVRIQPSFPEAHTGLANVLDNLGHTDEAIAVYQESIRLKPAQADAHNNLGNVLFKIGRYSEAIAQYAEAVRLKPDMPDPHNGLGAALSADGRDQEAIAHYLASLRLRADPDVYFNAAISFTKIGNRQEAIRHFEAALQLNPAHELARAELEKIRQQGK